MQNQQTLLPQQQQQQQQQQLLQQQQFIEQLQKQKEQELLNLNEQKDNTFINTNHLIIGGKLGHKSKSATRSVSRSLSSNDFEYESVDNKNTIKEEDIKGSYNNIYNGAVNHQIDSNSNNNGVYHSKANNKSIFNV